MVSSRVNPEERIASLISNLDGKFSENKKKPHELEDKEPLLKKSILEKDLYEIAKILQGFKKSGDQRYQVTENFLWCAIELFEEELGHPAKPFACRQKIYGNEIFAALGKATHAALSFLSLKSITEANGRNLSSTRELLNALDMLQDEIKGPFFYRKEDARLRRFVAVLAIITGMALFVASVLLSPLVTLGCAIAGCALGGALVGVGFYFVLDIEDKMITEQKQQVIDNFSASAKALAKSNVSSFFASGKHTCQESEVQGQRVAPLPASV